MYENYGWKYILTALIAILWGLALYWQGVPLGLDLKGGAEIIYRLEVNGQAASGKVTEDAVSVLRKRIDKLGIKELGIRRMGADKVLIQIPSATPLEVEKLKTQIEKAGKMEFKLVVGSGDLKANARDYEVTRVLDEKERGIWQDNDRYDVAHWNADARGGTAGAPVLLYNCTTDGKPIYVDGGLLEDANKAMDDKGRPCVGFTWGPIGRKKFFDLTSNNVGEQLAVVLDGELRSAPEIRGPIGKKGIIEGGQDGWDEKELLDLIIILKAGALPAKPVFAYSKRVGATLGQAAVTIGGLSICGSMFVVFLFMLYYYRVRSGLIADIALALNLFLIVGTLAMFDATLTLPGIAGILLTAGMAVDANILIYERIREEIARGSKLRQAIQAGYDRAFWTIFDANLTTALTAVVLMKAGTGPIKGFGVTLTIGIVISMFTALFVTKALYGFFVAKEFLTQIEFRELFPRPKFDFFANRSKAVTISLTMICIGWLVFTFRGSDKYGIDFTGGTVMQMRLRQPMEKSDVVEALQDHFGAKIPVEVQRVGALIEGGQELGREWLLRTRLVGAKKAEKKISTGPSFSLLSPAYGQESPPTPEGGDAPTPEGGDTPTPEGGDTPTPEGGDTPTPEGGDTPAPEGGDTPAPEGGDTPAPEQPAKEPAAEAVVDTSAQDFFEKEVRTLFKEKLVNPYPLIETREYTLSEPDTTGAVRARFQVNLVALGKGLAVGNDTLPAVTVEQIKTELPPVLRRMAHRLRNATAFADKSRRAVLTALGGEDGGAIGFEVVALEDPDTTDSLTPFEFRTHLLRTADEKPATLAVEVFKAALEKAREQQVYFAPGTAFPSIDQVGSAVAKNLKSKAIISTFFCVVFICLYVWLRFDFWSGIAAIMAVFHDVLALLGFLAILDFVLTKVGSTFDVKFGLTTISAFLTVVGYSINDTIVILDRIREDKNDAKAKTYTADLVNGAINKTLMRTVLTSLTSLLVCVVLLVGSMFGLNAIQGFAVSMVFGVIVGTYSSIFIASPVLLVEKRKLMIICGSVATFMIVTGIASNFVPV
jgi:SecD/SecF fusion protein